MIQLRYRIGKNGVPIMKDKDIDIDAERLLKDYKPELLKAPQPLDIDDFTESYLGLNIHFENLSCNRSILGCMVFNNRKIPVYVPELKHAEYCPVDADTVVIDNSLLDGPNEYVFRSTMLHECGHKLYHAQIYREDDNQLSFFSEEPSNKTAVVVCRKKDIVGSGRVQRQFENDQDWIEHHAKYFSAAMLMPKSMVELACADASMQKMISEEFQGHEDDFLAEHLSELFNVSPMSARIRIKQLGLGFNMGKRFDGRQTMSM